MTLNGVVRERKAAGKAVGALTVKEDIAVARQVGVIGLFQTKYTRLG